mgnify:CR=1 FL=1
MDIIKKLAEELQIRPGQAQAAVKLIDEGNTIPFISRYRKEVTGALNDEVLRNLNDRLTYLRNLEEKKTQVLSSIEEQGKLTEEIKKQILEAQTLVVVEVKTRSGEEYQQPEEAVDARKMRNLAIAANTYVKEQKVEKELRFDIVTVVGVGHQVKRIEHLVDAFNPLLIG